MQITPVTLQPRPTAYTFVTRDTGPLLQTSGET